MRLPGPVLGLQHPTAGKWTPPPILAAPVELATTFIVPVEHGVQKKAYSPLKSRRSDSQSPTRWELAHNRVKGRFKRYITPHLENIEDLPREPPAQRWQKLPNDMGKFNIGVIDEDGPRPILVLTLLHQELYQQVIIAPPPPLAPYISLPALIDN